jgi:Ca-activated chloride channel family protein
MPDLFPGRPILLTGRFNGEPPAFVNVRARSGQDYLALNAPVFHQDASPALASIWARSKIADLSMRAIGATWFDHKAEIRRTALDYNLLSQFTSFVAVDSTHRTEGWSGTTVPVPVPVPDGVKYETTVRE